LLRSALSALQAPLAHRFFRRTPMDDDGKSDPYVKIDIDGHSLKETRVVKKSLNPEWDEKITFMLEPAHVFPRPARSRLLLTSHTVQYRNGLDKVTIHFNCWDAD